MAELNKGFNSSDPVPPYDQRNIPGQPITYGNAQGPNVMYGAPQGHNVNYGAPQGQNMMYGGPQGQNAMYGGPQGQGYGQQMYNGNPQQADFWMDRPSVAGCPPGLEYLTKIDQLLVKQRIEMFEVLTGYETNNKYDVKNTLGQTVYKAKEDTGCCNRYFCGANRQFVIHITDNMNQEVIQIRRNYKCNFVGQCFSCSKCCQDEIEIEAPPGVVVGYVKQAYEGCDVRYSIMNEMREVVLKIHGPSYCYCYCPGDDYPLSLMSANGEIEVGKISKQWSNIIQEYFTDADNFGIQFPMDLDVKMKAVVLGAVFLIDFMFFEKSGSNRRHFY